MSVLSYTIPEFNSNIAHDRQVEHTAYTCSIRENIGTAVHVICILTKTPCNITLNTLYSTQISVVAKFHSLCPKHCSKYTTNTKSHKRIKDQFLKNIAVNVSTRAEQQHIRQKIQQSIPH